MPDTSIKLYVAGKFEQREEISNIMDELRTLGFTITFDWTQRSTDPWLIAARNDLNGVKACDALLAIFTHRADYKGAYAEIGAALALDKPVFILGDYGDRCLFTALCCKINELDDLIIKLRRN